MCKFCRYQKCRASGMNPDEVRSGSNTPASSPPPKGSATQSAATSPKAPVLSPVEESSSASTPLENLFMKSFHRALVLENSVFVATQNPVLLSAYLQPPHDSRLLENALKNFEKVSEKFGTFNNSFILQYLETAGITLDAKIIEKIPKIFELVHQSFQQYAELIKIRCRSEFEFAALCQLSLLKIASEEFPHFQPILTQNYEIVTQNFREFFANELGENPDTSVTNLSDLATTIHLIRKTYRNRIVDLLKN